MKKLLFLFIIILFLLGCEKEEISNLENVTSIGFLKVNETNKTINNTDIKSKIPDDFIETCKFNHQIELVTFFQDQKICLNGKELVIGIKNIGFDPINSLKIIIKDKEIISEEKELINGKQRKYRFDDIEIQKDVEKIIIIPRGNFYDDIYDCEESKLIIKKSEIETCIII